MHDNGFSLKVNVSVMLASEISYYECHAVEHEAKWFSAIVIVCCLVVEHCNITQKEYLFFSRSLNFRNIGLAFQGVLFLLYPLVGHLTDIYLTRYRSLKLSYGILIFTACAAVVYSGIDLAASSIWKITIFHHWKTVTVWIIMFLVYSVGLGLFEANAIQFGLDQLLEAPTPKLIAFIHWYYWAQNVGSLAFFYITESGLIISKEIDLMTNATISQALYKQLSSSVVIPQLIVMTIILTGVLIKICTTKKHFYVQKTGLNPFKNIYKVLKYSWKHKVPEHRSAFTYWEEDIPRRIDLGKNKYGGPFTNEEVEDTKTFLCILPLLL